MKEKILILVAFIGIPVVLLVSSRHDPIDSVVLVYNDGGHGSGVIVAPNAVLTAKHVAVHDNLTVRANDGTEYAVTEVVLDTNSDAALLLIDGTFSEPALEVSCLIPSVGASIMCIGTPYEVILQNCVLHGRIVKTGVDAEDGENDLLILDAHIGPGCSGGPVVYRGKVVGIVTISIGQLGGAVPCIEFAGSLGL